MRGLNGKRIVVRGGVTGIGTAVAVRAGMTGGRPAMRVRVDREACCGSGQCAMIAPEVFDQDEDDGLVLLLDAAPPEPAHPAVREAAAVCPASAITASED